MMYQGFFVRLVICFVRERYKRIVLPKESTKELFFIDALFKRLAQNIVGTIEPCSEKKKVTFYPDNDRLRK